MKRVQVRPEPTAVINSLRALGYSFETALADIIDNSISAQSTRVDIVYTSMPRPTVAIIDNGTGMDADTLVAAMRHGSTDPRAVRRPHDLGRYGLGLKTASLSQCRILTVATLAYGNLSAARWDLDEIERDRDWTLGILEANEISAVPGVDVLKNGGRGTAVIWQGFDRLSAGPDSEASAVEHAVDASREHISLTFHRFLGSSLGPEKSAVITINRTPLERADPFLTENSKTEALPPETLFLRDHPIRVQAYILPSLRHIHDERIRENLRRCQGFYLYRNDRLICHGTWFQLLRNGDLTKLARVSIDISNAIDDQWNIDIRKAVAEPPPQIKPRLKELINRIAARSEIGIRGRRRRLSDERIVPVWIRELVSRGVTYRINREHPMISGIVSSAAPDLAERIKLAIASLELSLPLDLIARDVAKTVDLDPYSDTDIYQELRRIAVALLESAPSRSALISQLPLIEPFSRYHEQTQLLLQELLA